MVRSDTVIDSCLGKIGCRLINHFYVFSQVVELSKGQIKVTDNFFPAVSYLFNGTFSIVRADTFCWNYSEYGVPQGSILGPPLVLMYMLPLRQVLKNHHVLRLCFANNTEPYIPHICNNTNSIASVFVSVIYNSICPKTYF